MEMSSHQGCVTEDTRRSPNSSMDVRRNAYYLNHLFQLVSEGLHNTSATEVVDRTVSIYITIPDAVLKSPIE